MSIFLFSEEKKKRKTFLVKENGILTSSQRNLHFQGKKKAVERINILMDTWISDDAQFLVTALESLTMVLKRLLKSGMWNDANVLAFIHSMIQSVEEITTGNLSPEIFSLASQLLSLRPDFY